MTSGESNNIRLGTCKVFFDNVDLGLTIGGVELTVETSTHETKCDQFGETVVDERITGRNIKCKVPMAETTIENLVKIMPGSKLTANGANKKVVVTTGAGISLLSLSRELRLHPIALPDAQKSEDVVIHKAATAGAMNFAYKMDEERVFNVEFKGYPNAADGVLYSVGDLGTK